MSQLPDPGETLSEEKRHPWTAKLKGEVPLGTEIGCERLHLPGIVVNDRCPKCKEKQAHLFSEESYLVNPKNGVGQKIMLCCDACKHEWPGGHLVVTLKVSLEEP